MPRRRARRRSKPSTALANTASTARQRRVIPGEGVAQAIRQRQHPLPDRQSAEHVVRQVGGQLGHTSAAARPAKPASLARERHKDLVSAIVAAETGEAARQHPASDKLSQFTLDEERHSFAAASLAGLGEERFEVLADHAVQNGALRLPRDVRASPATARSCVQCPISASGCRDRSTLCHLGCRVHPVPAERTPCRCRGAPRLLSSPCARSNIRHPW
jgi:hypothetical protein